MIREAKDIAPDLIAAGHTVSVFQEEPVGLDVFVQDKAYLHNPPLSPRQRLAVQHAERIFYAQLYPLMAAEGWTYWAEPVRLVNTLTLQWGKGSGKDHICRMASLRIAYLLLCLKSPQEYFGLPIQDTIHSLNVASSASQAHNAFFKPMTQAVTRGWFKDRCEPRMLKIVWDKNVESISGHSDAETQEGLNLILGIADEVDAFKSAEEGMRQRNGAPLREASSSIETILTMLKTSASTRFPYTYKFMRIAYPRYEGSTIQRLTKEADAIVAAQGAFASHYVDGPADTWDVNPRFNGMDRVVVPHCDVPVPKVYEQDFLDDPAEANAKYRCRPSRSSSPYFRNFDPVEACLTGVNPLQLDYRLVRNANGGRDWEPVYLFASDFHPISGAQYAMHADLATKHDRAGIGMSHIIRWETTEVVVYDDTGTAIHRHEDLPVVKVDFAIAFEADLFADPSRQIQLRWARQLCFALRERGFHIPLFTFDGWQSLDSIQALEARGIEAKVQSLDKTDIAWKTLRDLTSDGRVLLPKLPMLKAELEGLTLGRGGKVDHPVGGSKDLADGVGGSILGALELGGEEDPTGAVASLAEETFELFPLSSGRTWAGFEIGSESFPDGLADTRLW